MTIRRVMASAAFAGLAAAAGCDKPAFETPATTQALPSNISTDMMGQGGGKPGAKPATPDAKPAVGRTPNAAAN